MNLEVICLLVLVVHSMCLHRVISLSTLLSPSQLSQRCFVFSTGASLWCWVACQARYLSRLGLFPCEPHKSWGGAIMIRRADFTSVAQSSYYNEDAAFERAANERDMIVYNPPYALFPIHCSQKTVLVFSLFDLCGMCCVSALKTNTRTHKNQQK